ncbi:MAG: undecaprenyl/decaprenyl-phosphate alpha-N-acetylglucosaminyl 1-phosphate transferase [Oscillospiraceae bacterium]|jgi:UDP-GlcNAc:undecaprenyl-phosphate GlcNAc-1-phosphate transferase|nr:undecaprenyl/decaprenyl-phosphate alpha-N-acetylglucosaminyl 1-phosphate transferase [Oscillospiraceae bacterium]
MPEDFPLILWALLTLFTGGVLSFAASPLVRQFAHTVGAIDVPRDGRRMHTKPTPRLGGLAIFLGFLVAVLLFADIDRSLQGILLGAVVVVVLGVIDDIVRLPAWIKFLVQIGAALIPVFHGVVIEFFSNPIVFSATDYIDLGFLAKPLTVLWIVAITNSVNLIDGLDGLAAGVSAISSVSLLVISLILMQPNVAILMAALAGACVGFMPYNFNPAKMFMGDTGATFLGFILASVSVMGLFKFYTIISFAVPFLILGLPIFDTLSAVFRRLARGKSPMSADRGHIHHRLIDMGFSQKQSVAILYTLSSILAVAAVVLTTSGELKAMLFILAVLVAVALSAKLFGGKKKAGQPPEPAAANGSAEGPPEQADAAPPESPVE